MNRRQTPLVLDYLICVVATVCVVIHIIGMQDLVSRKKKHKITTRSMVIGASVGILILELDWINSWSPDYSIWSFAWCVWELLVLFIFIYTYFVFRND